MCNFKKSWKEKAVERTKTNIALKKRNKELETSRDNWKEKADKFKELYNLEKETLKKN